MNGPTRNRWENLGLAGWEMVVVLSAGGAGWTVVNFFRGSLPAVSNSDAAVPVLLAAEMLRSRAWVPASWYYVNDDIWLLAPQLFCLPFVSAWGPTVRALAAGNVLGLAVTALCVFPLARRLLGSAAAAAVVVLGLLAPFSGLQRELVVAQLAYGWIFGLLCLLLTLALRITEREASTAREVLARPLVWAYLLLVAVLSAGSVGRWLVYWLVPLLAVCLWEGRSRQMRARFAGLATVSVAGFGIGAAVHFVVRAGLHTGQWQGVFHTQAGWGRKLGLAWQGLPWLIGTPPMLGSGWLSAEGGLAVLRIAFFAAALLALVLVWRRGEARPPPAVRIGARFDALLCLALLAAFVSSRMVGAFTGVRYLLPPALLALLVLIALSAQGLGPRSTAFLGVTGLFAAAFVWGGVLATPGAAAAPPTVCQGEPRLCPILSVAEAHRLRAGLAAYWDANASTLASGGTVRVCPVVLEPTLGPYRWLTSSGCFDEDGYRGGFFVALRKDEHQAAGGEALVAALGPPAERAPAGEFEVWIYQPSPERSWSWLAHR